jgi:hypothetical protein
MPVTRKKITSPIHRHDPTNGNMLDPNFYRKCGADNSSRPGQQALLARRKPCFKGLEG